ncbi:MAG: hypothetical protein V4594_00840 [Bacteroidota bacterium]
MLSAAKNKNVVKIVTKNETNVKLLELYVSEDRFLVNEHEPHLAAMFLIKEPIIEYMNKQTSPQSRMSTNLEQMFASARRRNLDNTGIVIDFAQNIWAGSEVWESCQTGLNNIKV